MTGDVGLEVSSEAAPVPSSLLLLSLQKLLSPPNRDLIQADAMVTGPETQVRRR